MVATTNMVFSEATNKTGMYELFQDLTGLNSSSYSAYKYARDANNALLDYFMLAAENSGSWQVDDTNQTDYPEILSNLVSGQFDYPLTSDGSSSANQILDIERIEIANSNGTFYKIYPEDEMDDNNSIVFKRTITGVPITYSKKANGIFLNPTPNYSYTNGIKIFFQRTPTYFVGTDTTKVAGIPHAHQEYLVYRPAFLYCSAKGLSMKNDYFAMLQKIEGRIKDYYARREKDVRKTMTSAPIKFR